MHMQRNPGKNRSRRAANPLNFHNREGEVDTAVVAQAVRSGGGVSLVLDAFGPESRGLRAAMP